MWWIHIAEPYCLLQCVCFRLIFVSAQAFVINTIIVLANGYDLLSCLHLCYNTKIKPLKIEPYAIPTHRNWADSVRIKHVRMKHDCWNSTFNQLTLVCPVMYPVLARIMVFCFWRAARQEKKGGGQRTETGKDVECVFEGFLVTLGYTRLRVISLHSSLFHLLTSLLAKSLWHCVTLYDYACMGVILFWSARDKINEGAETFNVVAVVYSTCIFFPSGIYKPK